MEPNFLSALALASLAALANPSVQSSTIGSYELPAIAGLWQIELDEQNGCKELYNFGRDGNLTTVSGEERTYGEYRFAYVEDNSLPVIAIKTLHDNNQPDCSGNQVDQTGDTIATYVKLDTRHDPKQMYWCDDSQGVQCRVRFLRQLP